MSAVVTLATGGEAHGVVCHRDAYGNLLAPAGINIPHNGVFVKKTHGEVVPLSVSVAGSAITEQNSGAVYVVTAAAIKQPLPVLTVANMPVVLTFVIGEKINGNFELNSNQPSVLTHGFGASSTGLGYLSLLQADPGDFITVQAGWSSAGAHVGWCVVAAKGNWSNNNTSTI